MPLYSTHRYKREVLRTTNAHEVDFNDLVWRDLGSNPGFPDPETDALYDQTGLAVLCKCLTNMKIRN